MYYYVVLFCNYKSSKYEDKRKQYIVHTLDSVDIEIIFSFFNHILSENPGCPDPSSHDLFGCCLIQPDSSSTQQRSNPATQTS